MEPGRIGQPLRLLRIGLDRSLILRSRKSFWCIWWAQGSLIAVKPGSWADASTAHSGLALSPPARSGYKRAQPYISDVPLNNFYICLQCERHKWYSGSKEKQNNTWILGLHKAGNEHLDQFYREGFLTDQTQNPALACCSTGCSLRAKGALALWGREGDVLPSPQSWYLMKITREHGDGITCQPKETPGGQMLTATPGLSGIPEQSTSAGSIPQHSLTSSWWAADWLGPPL